jgi:L-aminopeptidase/D-esterase-like protein
MLSNDNTLLTPNTDWDGPVLEFDEPAVHIGVAEYPEGPTGCTVFYFPKEVKVACDVRGGLPGTIMASDGYADAIFWAGGSLCGLEAAAGVRAELFARSNYNTNLLPLVRGAIIHDYGLRQNVIYPDKALGRAALKTARPGIFPLGARGAGCCASVGKLLGRMRGERGGQGAAFTQIDETKIIVFTLVNALGVVMDREQNVVRGNRDPITSVRTSLTKDIICSEGHTSGFGNSQLNQNTTLTLVVTNRNFSTRELAGLGRQVHSSMARAIQPFHTRLDGDVLFTVTTGEVNEGTFGIDALSVVASELAWDAVLSCFPRCDR